MEYLPSVWGITLHQTLIGFAHTCHDIKAAIFKLKPVSNKVQDVMRMLQARE
jgi:hypothetical protein